MKNTSSHTVRSLVNAFVETVEDLSQYISSQQQLGNNELRFSEKTRNTIEAWGTAAWYRHGFASRGPENAGIMIIDSLGSFFEGPPGELLTKILTAMRLTPGQVYICNTSDFARIQNHINSNRPGVIIVLGEEAGNLLLKREERLSAYRGEFHRFMDTPLMATHHPSALIENPGLKRQVWDDMQLVMKQAGL
ncbi:MAG: uracil-DNA glycosylase [Desulfobacterales bacterium]|nr:uracil-DNA glycosylase [Desulfobacterales bacterium]